MKNLEKNKSEMKAPQNYEVPAIEVLEIEVEKGFALSPGGPDDENRDPFPP